MKKYKVTVEGQSFTVVVEEFPTDQTGGAPAAAAPGPSAIPAPSAPDPQDKLSGDTSGLSVKSPMPGSIVDIAVKQGDNVKEGDVLLILEAMKMENEITAPQPGRVREVYVKVGDTVGSGEPLVEIS